MNRVGVAALVVAVAAASIGATLAVRRPVTTLAPQAASNAKPPAEDSRAEALTKQITSLRAENEALRRANLACLASAAATVDADDAQKKVVAQVLDDDRKRGGEEAAQDEHARTAAWSSHLASDLGLSKAQRAKLDDIAKWAEEQRGALADRADKESLDTKVVRDEIAKQREEYEQQVKTMLTPAQFHEFDAIQGIDRRPPTFARVPWILGDRSVPR